MTLCMKFFLAGVINTILPVMILCLSGVAISARVDYDIFKNDSTPYGSPYSNWIEKWWIWWDGIPDYKHPAKDYSNSERCSVMQDGPVWFLPDVLPGTGNLNYHCNIPIGKAIFASHNHE